MIVDFHKQDIISISLTTGDRHNSIFVFDHLFLLFKIFLTSQKNQIPPQPPNPQHPSSPKHQPNQKNNNFIFTKPNAKHNPYQRFFDESDLIFFETILHIIIQRLKKSR
jgi:hypothetical protein